MIAFYQQKYTWNLSTIQDITWEAHHRALTHLNGRHYKTIQQFIHRWLPTNSSPSLYRIGTAKQCPYCCSQAETQDHFLSCKHTTLQQIWETSLQPAMKKIIKYNSNVHHHIISLIKMSVREWRYTKHPTMPTFLDPTFHTLFCNQSLIGWNHIIMGRFSNTWIKVLEPYCINPIHWIAYVTQVLWHHVYDVWKIRCNRNHGENEQLVRQQAITRMAPQVEQLCSNISSVNLKPFFPQQPSSQTILQLPTQAIEQWLCKTRHRVKLSKQYIKQQVRNRKKNLPQHPFFRAKGTIPSGSRLKQRNVKTNPRSHTPKPKTTFMDQYYKIKKKYKSIELECFIINENRHSSPNKDDLRPP